MDLEPYILVYSTCLHHTHEHRFEIPFEFVNGEYPMGQLNLNVFMGNKNRSWKEKVEKAKDSTMKTARGFWDNLLGRGRN